MHKINAAEFIDYPEMKINHSTEEEFLSVINQHKRLIYKVSNLYCKDPDDRKDLQQEIIIQIWKSFKSYNSEYKLSTWLYRIALNTAISFYRKESTREKYNSMHDEIIHAFHSGDENEELNEKISLLYEFINELDKLNKALMILYLDNISYKEISEVLGITETNVATKISRIKQILRKKFSEKN